MGPLGRAAIRGRCSRPAPRSSRSIAIRRSRRIADALAAEFPSRFSFVAGEFSALDELAGSLPVDGVVLDIGVSSMQLDEAERGFSFMREGPLDMRMSGEGESAADLVNGLDEADLADLLYAFGEERKSRRIAHQIVAARATAPIAHDDRARAADRKGHRPQAGRCRIRRRASFQALRIAVNAEFDELVEGLFAAERLLPEGGRLAVVTFHSLEDRIVKRFFDPEKGGAGASRYLPQVETEARRWVDVAKARKAGRARAVAQSARALGDPAQRAAQRGAGAAGQLRRASACRSSGVRHDPHPQLHPARHLRPRR